MDQDWDGSDGQFLRKYSLAHARKISKKSVLKKCKIVVLGSLKFCLNTNTLFFENEKEHHHHHCHHPLLLSLWSKNINFYLQQSAIDGNWVGQAFEIPNSLTTKITWAEER